jgi:hypothetical protein
LIGVCWSTKRLRETLVANLVRLYGCSSSSSSSSSPDGSGQEADA